MQQTAELISSLHYTFEEKRKINNRFICNGFLIIYTFDRNSVIRISAQYSITRPIIECEFADIRMIFRK
jgi:hypothetical protein